MTTANVATVWQTFAGKRVTIHAPEGSYAARRAPNDLRDLDRAIDVLDELLAPPAERRGGPVDIYLLDPVADPDALLPGGARESLDVVGEKAIVRIVQPEMPGEPLILPVTRLLVARWYGPEAGSAGAFVDGIAGVAAAQARTGPSIEEAIDWIRGELIAGRPVSILAEPVPGSPPPDPRIATSFIAYLIEAYTPQALRDFLSAWDPARRDQAAIAASQQPLAVLEAGWQTALQRGHSGENAFKAILRYLLPLLRPYWIREVEVILYMGMGLVYTLALPLTTKHLIDTVLPKRDTHELVKFILFLFGIYVLNALIGIRRSYVSNFIHQRILVDLQERMFARMQRLSHRFYAAAKIGDIIARFSSDLQAVQIAMAQLAGVGIFLLMRAIAATWAIIDLSWKLGLLVLLVVPIFAISYLLLLIRLGRASFERQERTGQALSAVEENLAAHTVVKAYGMEDAVTSAYRVRLGGQMRATLRLMVLGTLYEASIDLAVTLAQLIVLGVGGYMAINGDISIGTLFAFIALLPSLFEPVASIGSLGETVQTGAGALDRVSEILEAPVEIEDKPDAVALPPLAGEIHFERVSFSYDGVRPALRDIDLVIPANRFVAIVGPSGSGKSTVANLLLRFWDVDEGQVLLDGLDVRDVTVASLRGQIGIVFQETFVFDTTVRENIAIGRPGASDGEIAAAAVAARLDAYIASLPLGYDTVLGERGTRMSGGQRQRLAIARALVRNPRILILDEATSALDAQTEKEILANLATVARGRTTIAITHRLGMAALADEVVVLADGRLVEQGTPEELVRAGGMFQSLWEEQMGRGAAVREEIDPAHLRRVPLFAGLGDESLRHLARRLTVERFGPGTDVVRQGDAGHDLYIIGSGQVEVLVGDNGSQRQVNVLGPGDYFGEMALLMSQPRSATVRATMPARLYSLAQSDLAWLIEREPALRRSLAETSASRQAALASAAAMASASRVTTPAADAAGPAEPRRFVGRLRPTGGSIGAEVVVLPFTRPFRIGRDSTCELQLFDPRVSRNHARIDYYRDEFVITDLDSANGVYVQGQRIAGPVILRDGDRIEIGNMGLLRFRFELAPAGE